MTLSSLLRNSLRLEALARKFVSMCPACHSAPVQEIWRLSVPVLRGDSLYAALCIRDHAAGQSQADQLLLRGC